MRVGRLALVRMEGDRRSGAFRLKEGWPFGHLAIRPTDVPLRPVVTPPRSNPHFQEFMSEEAPVRWVKSRALDNGYIVVKRRTKKSKTLGSVIKVWLMCDRGGEHNSIAIFRRSGSKKIGCLFQLIVLYNEVRESWKLQVINNNHNHEPAQNLEDHPYVRRFTQEEQDMVENLTEQHIDPRNILSSIKKHNPANVSISKDVYNLQ
ncbi:hypothetical protein E3N88_14584 [Mikania micrantha]|uniref:FAR1 domain-containing protein n=1 Tax=Mikania micrantha TaxID=192012 RepID=A0A5N6P1U7_9ASTR|nr:hypothetical protein E3N88_14584 [Mikania micrantha]